MQPAVDLSSLQRARTKDGPSPGWMWQADPVAAQCAGAAICERGWVVGPSKPVYAPHDVGEQVEAREA